MLLLSRKHAHAFSHEKPASAMHRRWAVKNLHSVFLTGNLPAYSLILHGIQHLQAPVGAAFTAKHGLHVRARMHGSSFMHAAIPPARQTTRSISMMLLQHTPAAPIAMCAARATHGIVMHSCDVHNESMANQSLHRGKCTAGCLTGLAVARR